MTGLDEGTQAYVQTVKMPYCAHLLLLKLLYKGMTLTCAGSS